MAGGSGTRLWPMSRADLPKQLIPFIDGKSLLQLAYERLDGLVVPERRYVGASQAHAERIRTVLGLGEAQFFGEPVARDTLNAVGLAAAVLVRRDPQAVIAVFTADHVIEPVAEFQKIVAHGFQLAESGSQTLVTFGIAPTTPATAYGYLELGASIDGTAREVRQFREKPDALTADRYFASGPERYLWNSGMFVWRATTLLDCLRRYEPGSCAALESIADAWDTPRRESVLAEVFPKLRKTSVDFAVMEPASRDSGVLLAAVPMPLRWLDIGSWPMFAETCPKDAHGNALGARRALLVDTRHSIVASSESGHVIATLGCEDLIVIHTPDATLVCHKDRAESIKDLQRLVGERFGEEFL